MEIDEETGLYYFGARYYDPRISIWYGVDPLASKTPSWNPYRYSFNNPIRFIDPNGMNEDDPPGLWGKLIEYIKSWFDSNVPVNKALIGSNESRAEAFEEIEETKENVNEVKNEALKRIEDGAGQCKEYCENVEQGSLVTTGVTLGASAHVTGPVASVAEIGVLFFGGVEMGAEYLRTGTISEETSTDFLIEGASFGLGKYLGGSISKSDDFGNAPTSTNAKNTVDAFSGAILNIVEDVVNKPTNNSTTIQPQKANVGPSLLKLTVTGR